MTHKCTSKLGHPCYGATVCCHLFGVKSFPEPVLTYCELDTFRNLHLTRSFTKFQPFCYGLNALNRNKFCQPFEFVILHVWLGSFPRDIPSSKCSFISYRTKSVGDLRHWSEQVGLTYDTFLIFVPLQNDPHAMFGHTRSHLDRPQAMDSFPEGKCISLKMFY